MTEPDEYFMAQAIRQAEQGLYTCHPNPRVGCVLVAGGKVISEGFHAKTGGAHAEADALSRLAAMDQLPLAAGATAYVTMEPCSFHGRTPSCAEALIKHKVSKVVYAMEDPHPKNRGVGFDKLRAAGIEVIGPVLEAEARLLNPGHLRKYAEDGALARPFVRLKAGMSLDGKTALGNGASQWITSSAARRDVQKLRARSAAIITGVQTVIDDDPSLTVRESELDHPFAKLAAEVPRKVVVLDTHGRFPAAARLAGNPNLVLVSAEPRADLAATEWHISAGSDNRIDLNSLMERLIAEDCNEVLFECGPTLGGSLLNSGLVDELVIYMAPRLLGDDARSLVNWPRITNLQDALSLAFTDVRAVGEDLRITAKPIHFKETI